MHALEAELKAAGVRATVDPREAATNRPCVLIAPPTVNYQTAATTHRLLCLSGHDNPDLEGLEQLDALVAEVVAALAGFVERAEPTAYALGASSPSVPAYLITVTT
jgi:hypothetical protein